MRDRASESGTEEGREGEGERRRRNARKKDSRGGGERTRRLSQDERTGESARSAKIAKDNRTLGGGSEEQDAGLVRGTRLGAFVRVADWRNGGWLLDPGRSNASYDTSALGRATFN